MTNNLDVFSSLMKEQIRGSLSDACAVILWLYKYEGGFCRKNEVVECIYIKFNNKHNSIKINWKKTVMARNEGLEKYAFVKLKEYIIILKI